MITQKTPAGAPARQEIEERLLAFSVRIVGAVGGMKDSLEAGWVGERLLRSGTGVYVTPGEGEGDFVSEVRLRYRELRETYRWLRLVQRTELIEEPGALDPLIEETDQLIRISAAGLRTLRESERTRPA